MPQPSFAGDYCFGQNVSCLPEQDKNQAKIGDTFGADGISRAEPGDRGVTITVTGTHYGDSTLELAAAHQRVRAHCDGRDRPFVDTLGTTWRVCLLDHFAPVPPVRHPPGGQYRQNYKVRVLCLRQ